jgi:hypothetical protein
MDNRLRPSIPGSPDAYFFHKASQSQNLLEGFILLFFETIFFIKFILLIYFVLKTCLRAFSILLL